MSSRAANRASPSAGEAAPIAPIEARRREAPAPREGDRSRSETPAARWRAGLRVSGATVGRDGAPADFGGTLGLAAARGRWGLRLDGTVVDVSEGALVAQQWWVAAGPTAALGLTPAWALELSLRGGVALHAYRLRGESGTRIDFVADLPVTLAWKATGWLTAEAWLAPGVASQARQHVVNEERIWRRGAARLSGGLGIRADLFSWPPSWKPIDGSSVE